MGPIRLPDSDQEATRTPVRSKLAWTVLCAALVTTIALQCMLQQLPMERKPPSSGDPLYDADISLLQDLMRNGSMWSQHLTEWFLMRWYYGEQSSLSNVTRTLIAFNQACVDDAIALDEERSRSQERSLLHGIPIIIRDNIDVADISTTAGSWALNGSLPAGDSEVVRRLREAGAVIMCNLHEWGGARSHQSSPSWSAMGGQAGSFFFKDGSPRSSSGGTTMAVAASFCMGAVDSDTRGSIIQPASASNVIGVRPTIGLVSRWGMIPYALSRDSPGPIANSVRDAAILLSIMAGPDDRDVWTRAQPKELPDYLVGLKKSALKGARIGVIRNFFPKDIEHAGYGSKELLPAILVAYEGAIKAIRKLGAIVVDPADFKDIDSLLNDAVAQGCTYPIEGAVQIAEYLATLKRNPNNIKNVQDIIDFNNAHPDREKPPTDEGQELFELAASTQGYNTTCLGLQAARQLAARSAIHELFTRHHLDAVVWPASLTIQEGFAEAGFPAVTVPLGFLPIDTEAQPIGNHTPPIWDPYPTMPFGLAFGGTAWSEDRLLAYAYAFERSTWHRFDWIPDWYRQPPAKREDLVPALQNRTSIVGKILGKEL